VIRRWIHSPVGNDNTPETSISLLFEMVSKRTDELSAAYESSYNRLRQLDDAV
jgi:hypothetical protein